MTILEYMTIINSLSEHCDYDLEYLWNLNPEIDLPVSSH